MPGIAPGIGAKLDYIYCAALAAGAGGGLPDQAGNAGEFLTTDGTDASWAPLPAGGDLLAANNLSDVDNIVTSRSSLDLIPSSANAVIHASKSTLATDTRTGLSDYDPFRPFATLTPAQTAGDSGDLIIVWPGAFAPTTFLGKTGVNWDFKNGAQIVRTENGSDTAIFGDNSDPMTFRVTGKGYFKLLQGVTGAAFGAVISQFDALSDTRFEFDTLYGTSVCNDEQGVYGIIHGGGTLVAEGIDIISENTAGTPNGTVGVYWTNGPLHVNTANIITRGDTGVLSEAYLAFVANAPTGHAYLTSDYYSSDGIAVIHGKSSQSTATSWIQGKVLENTDVGASILAADADRIYATGFQKFLGAIVTSGSGAGLLYAGSDKLAAVVNGASGAACMLHAASSGITSRIDVWHWDAGAFTGETIKVTAGVVKLRGMDFTGGANTKGIELTGGTLILENCYINTAANNATNPITKSGGILKMYNCVLVAEATRDSISAPTAQNVVAVNCWANTALDADVTITTAGGLTIDADVA